MTLRSFLQQSLLKRGYSLTRNPVHRFFDSHNFDVILDVGANRGQYATQLRKDFGFRNRIVSFEPMKTAFDQLCNQMGNDSRWTGHHCGLGRESGTQTINIAGNSASSSMFEMLSSHTDVLPGSAYVSTEEIDVRKLDDEFDSLVAKDEKVLLKIDTQGFEMEVLLGAARSLANVSALQLELSLSPLYKEAPLFEEVIAHVRSLGFVPYWFTQGFWNFKTHQLLQMDGFFIRQTVDEIDT